MKLAFYLYVQGDTIAFIIGPQFNQPNATNFVKIFVRHVEPKEREVNYGLEAVSRNISMTQTHNRADGCQVVKE